MARFKFIILLILSFRLVSAQQDLPKPYGDLQFREGIFLSFDEVRNNSPVAKSMIKSQIAYDDPEFFQKILEGREIQYFDGLGIVRTVPVKEIWGYSRNGFLYIALNGGFYRINILGSICHFIASQKVYDNYYNPYNSYYNPYNPYYYSPYSSTVSNEMRQYLLDFTTGNVLDYDVSSVEVLLMPDPELHDEYMALGKKKKQQQRFVFIRRYNEKHPVELHSG